MLFSTVMLQGCNQGIIDWANEKLYILIGVALGVAALEVSS